jgi:hypothetical protein
MHVARTGGGLALLAAVALLAACGRGGAAAGPGEGSAASCAALPPGGALAQARVAFVGVALPGPTARLGNRRLLISPARMRVRRYLKGTGPRIVRVQTGVFGDGAFGSEGIDPAPGERWIVYTRSERPPYATGVCDGSKRIARASRPDPPSFAAVASDGGLTSTVELRSAATGRVLKRIATFGESFTNNGLAVSPDRSEVYVTLIGRRHLRIERVAVADGRRTFVAAGEEPALSPNGRRLAYVAARPHRSQTLAVRDLRSGRTRTVDVGRLMDRSVDLFNGTVTWLRGGSDVVAIPGEIPIAAGGARPATGAADPTCASATCLIVVHTTGRRLRAHRVVLSREPNATMRFAGDGAHRGSLLLADSSAGPTTVDRVSLHGTRADVVRLLSLDITLPVAFSPSGARLLYLVGHSPPALWVARIGRGHLVHPHRLLRDARLGGVAW